MGFIKSKIKIKKYFNQHTKTQKFETDHFLPIPRSASLFPLILSFLVLAWKPFLIFTTALFYDKLKEFYKKLQITAYIARKHHYVARLIFFKSRIETFAIAPHVLLYIFADLALNMFEFQVVLHY